LGTRRLGLTICEDVWNDEDFWRDRRYRRNPAAELAVAGAELIVNISASPWHLGKDRTRGAMLESLVRKTGVPLVYCNLVGGNDELIFDGGSLVLNGQGEIVGAGRRFEEDFVVVDTERTALASAASHVGAPASGTASSDRLVGTVIGAPASGTASLKVTWQSGEAPDEKEIYEALVLGTRDYLGKCGFKSALLGLSGGIDSAVTACLAVAALGAENVRGVALPSPYSSQGSLDDARALASNLGIRYDVIPIGPPFGSVKGQLQEMFEGRAEDVTEENIQARLRGVILMALSNKFGALLLTTGNKSELAVGYCTLYGDMCGGLAVISDVPKTMIYRLARWINREREIIPSASLTKPPSAELRPNQTDQDSLPPYEVLDAILERYVVEAQSVEDIVRAGYDPGIVSRVARLIDASEYKRRQAAPGLKVTSKAFGVGRRIPIAQRYR
jgi:NAD+ synthase (glutamine-hydrolysing)